LAQFHQLSIIESMMSKSAYRKKNEALHRWRSFVLRQRRLQTAISIVTQRRISHSIRSSFSHWLQASRVSALQSRVEAVSERAADEFNKRLLFRAMQRLFRQLSVSTFQYSNSLQLALSKSAIRSTHRVWSAWRALISQRRQQTLLASNQDTRFKSCAIVVVQRMQQFRMRLIRSAFCRWRHSITSIAQKAKVLSKFLARRQHECLRHAFGVWCVFNYRTCVQENINQTNVMEGFHAQHIARLEKENQVQLLRFVFASLRSHASSMITRRQMLRHRIQCDTRRLITRAFSQWREISLLGQHQLVLAAHVSHSRLQITLSQSFRHWCNEMRVSRNAKTKLAGILQHTWNRINSKLLAHSWHQWREFVSVRRVSSISVERLQSEHVHRHFQQRLLLRSVFSTMKRRLLVGAFGHLRSVNRHCMIQRAHAQIQSLESSIQEQTCQLNDLKLLNDRSAVEIEDLDSSIQQRTADLESSLAEIQNMRTTVSKLEADVESKTIEINSSNDQNTLLQHQLNQLQQTLDSDGQARLAERTTLDNMETSFTHCVTRMHKHQNSQLLRHLFISWRNHVRDAVHLRRRVLGSWIRHSHVDILTSSFRNWRRFSVLTSRQNLTAIQMSQRSAKFRLGAAFRAWSQLFKNHRSARLHLSRYVRHRSITLLRLGFGLWKKFAVSQRDAVVSKQTSSLSRLVFRSALLRLRRQVLLAAFGKWRLFASDTTVYRLKLLLSDSTAFQQSSEQELMAQLSEWQDRNLAAKNDFDRKFSEAAETHRIKVQQLEDVVRASQSDIKTLKKAFKEAQSQQVALLQRYQVSESTVNILEQNLTRNMDQLRDASASLHQERRHVQELTAKLAATQKSLVEIGINTEHVRLLDSLSQTEAAPQASLQEIGLNTEHSLLFEFATQTDSHSMTMIEIGVSTERIDSLDSITQTDSEPSSILASAFTQTVDEPVQSAPGIFDPAPCRTFGFSCSSHRSSNFVINRF
jgi:hypothetical protein